MSVELEDIIVSTARQLGVHPTALVMTQVALDLAGSVVVDGMIVIAGKGVLAPRDYIASLRARLPGGFAPLGPPPATTGNGNLTEQWKHEIAESRSKALPSDWQAVRSRVKGLTAEMMDDRTGGIHQ